MKEFSGWGKSGDGEKGRKKNENILRNKQGPMWAFATRLSVKFWTPRTPTFDSQVQEIKPRTQ